MREKMLQISTLSGPMLKIEDAKIIPVSQRIRLTRPFFQLLWQRPTTLQIEQNNQSIVVPIRDVTRLLQVTLFSLSLIFYLLGTVKKGDPHDSK